MAPAAHRKQLKLIHEQASNGEGGLTRPPSHPIPSLPSRCFLSRREGFSLRTTRSAPRGPERNLDEGLLSGRLIGCSLNIKIAKHFSASAAWTTRFAPSTVFKPCPLSSRVPARALLFPPYCGLSGRATERRSLGRWCSE